MNDNLHFLASSGTLEEFTAVYPPAAIREGLNDLDTLLRRACSNNDPATRVAISSFLLDEGANAASLDQSSTPPHTVLHSLLAGNVHDIPLEAPLLRRLINGGADINLPAGRFGTPLFAIARSLKFSDATLAPVYDAFFERPELDLLVVMPATGRTVLKAIELLSDAKRADLKRRATKHLDLHGSATAGTASR